MDGHALEKLAGLLYEERSRNGRGDFPLKQPIAGYWDRSNTEIDLVAIHETDQVLRFGSCKRSASKLIADVNSPRDQAARFLESYRECGDWKIESVGIAPALDAEARAILERHDVRLQDLSDLINGLE